MKSKAKQFKARPYISTYAAYECLKFESTEMEPFLIRALIASQEGNPQSLYQVIEDYRKSRGMSLIDEDVVDLLNKPYMGR